MIDVINDFCFKDTPDDQTGFDEQKITAAAMKTVLPLLMENELTAKQRACLSMFYIGGKSQTEIAKILHLSQPTVSHHIVTAKAISNKTLKYCLIAVAKANSCWLNAEESILNR